MSVHSEQLAPVPEPLLRPGKESQLSHNFGIKNRILEIIWYTFFSFRQNDHLEKWLQGTFFCCFPFIFFFFRNKHYC